MSSSDYREPTNDELWAQPPTGAAPGPHGGLAPLPQPQAPVPAHAPLPVPASSYLPAATPKPDRSVFVLAIVSTALAIPLTAIAAGTSGLAGLLIAWIGVVLVNAVYAWSRRHQG